MNTTTCIKDTEEPLALRIFAIVIVTLSFLATMCLLCFKLKFSWKKWRTDKHYFLRFSTISCVIIHNISMLFMLIYDHWSYIIGVDCEHFDVGINLFYIINNCSTFSSILLFYNLVYERYKVWDIFIDMQSVLKKRFLKLLEIVLHTSALLLIVYFIALYCMRLVENYMVIQFGHVADEELAVRQVMRGPLMGFESILLMFFLIGVSISTLYFDYYIIQAALVKSNDKKLPPAKKNSKNIDSRSPTRSIKRLEMLESVSNQIYYSQTSRLYRKMALLSLMDIVQITGIFLKQLPDIPNDVSNSIYGLSTTWLTLRCFASLSLIDDIYNSLKQTSNAKLLQLPTSIDYPSTDVAGAFKEVSNNSASASLQATSYVSSCGNGELENIGIISNSIRYQTSNNMQSSYVGTGSKFFVECQSSISNKEEVYTILKMYIGAPYLSDTKEPVAVRVVCILFVFAAMCATTQALCFKLKFSASKWRTDKHYFLRFSAAISLLFNNISMMFFLIFDHWAFLSGFDMDQYDIGVNLFEIFYLTSGVFCILYMYILIYDRYLLWDIFNDKYSMLKKRFFKIICAFYYYVHNCFLWYTTGGCINYDTIPDLEKDIRTILRGYFYTVANIIEIFFVIIASISSIYYDYYLIQAALSKSKPPPKITAQMEAIANHTHILQRRRLYLKISMISIMDAVQIIALALRDTDLNPDVMNSIYGLSTAWLTIRCLVTFALIDDIYNSLKQSSEIKMIQLPTSVAYPSTGIFASTNNNSNPTSAGSNYSYSGHHPTTSVMESNKFHANWKDEE